MRDQIVKYRGGTTTIHSPEEAEAAGPSIATVFPVYIAAHCDTCRSALDLGAPLGGTAAGVTGTIYSLRDIATRVVKRMEMRDDVARLNFMRELRVLKLMRQERMPSPSGDAERAVLVRMHACYVEFGVGYIVMDRHTTDLFDFVVSRGSYDARAPLIAPFAEQMALALDWLHSRGLSHCDVKLENVLVAATPPHAAPSFKLCDFGSAVRLDYYKMADPFKMGTFGYVPPREILAAYSANLALLGKVRDLWALATCIYIVIFEEFPEWIVRDSRHVSGDRHLSFLRTPDISHIWSRRHDDVPDAVKERFRMLMVNMCAELYPNAFPSSQ